MSDDLTRKEFIRLGAAATVALALPGCPSEDDGAETGADSEGGGECTGDATATISADHGHALTVPAADLAAGAAATYAIMGSSPHTHDVTLSAEEMADIAAGMTVSVVCTSAADHSHTLSIGC